MDSVKQPENPYLLIQDFTILLGLREFETTQSIALPSGDGNGFYDEGDYHFFIQLTDKEGWSSQKGLSIKILLHD